MQRRLHADHGYDVAMFSYPSITGTMAEHVTSLRAFAQAQNCERMHFVGHSLGGIVILKMLEAGDDFPQGRVVCLGSPLQGSVVVESFARLPFGRAALGAAIREEVLARKSRQWRGAREVGVIAGSSSIGMGRLFADFQEANDGTVLVSETQLAGAKDHVVMPVSHSGMVFSADVTKQIAGFLRQGAFTAAA